jgi:hypothetical protein
VKQLHDQLHSKDQEYAALSKHLADLEQKGARAQQEQLADVQAVKQQMQHRRKALHDTKAMNTPRKQE